MSDIQAQCWICPRCYDDKHHKPGDFHCLRQQLEASEARCAELEEFAADAQTYAWRALDPDYVPPDVESSMKDLLHRAAVITGEIDPDDIAPSAWLLRKQAEAVDKALDECAWWHDREYLKISEVMVYADSLRQAADEAKVKP